MSYSPWGLIQSQDQLIRGCKAVSTAKHGGILVSKNTISSHPYFSKIKEYDFSGFRENDGTYAFEEDLDANIILANLPKQVLSKFYKGCETDEGFERFQNQCLFALKNSYPEIFTLITGIELSIFESSHLFEEHLKTIPNLIFRDGAFSGYNIPDGYVAVSVKNAEGVDPNLYLVEREVYERDIKMPKGYLGYFPIDPQLLGASFELDMWTPSSIVKDAKDDHFYISHLRKKGNGSYIVLAYNYKLKDKLCFEMSQEYYDQSNISKNGIQVDDNLKPVDLPFISISEITPDKFING